MNNDSISRVSDPATSSYLGKLLDERYLIERELGRGGMGVVFLARDQQLLSRQVVVKVLLDKSFENEWVRSRFQREIEALTRMDHPGIVSVLDMGELPDGKPYFVMQFVEGSTLRSMVAKQPLPFPFVAALIRQVGHALTAAHEKGVVHRDLKPENIMVQALGDGEHQAKIIDFGVARVENSVMDEAPTTEFCVGTMKYMAPEQLMAKRPSAATDVYALGVITYELITGELPFRPASTLELFELQRDTCIVSPREFRPDLPAAAEEVIVKALSFEPSERYPRARDFADALARALVGNSSVSSRAAVGPVGSGAGVVLSESGARAATLRYRYAAQPSPSETSSPARPRLVTVVYKRNLPADESLVSLLESRLSEEGCQVFVDRALTVGVDWAREIERQIRASDAVIPVLSESSILSEMMSYEIQIAHEAAQARGGLPKILPVRVNYTGSLPEALAAILDRIEYALWKGEEDSETIVSQLLKAIRTPPRELSSTPRVNLEPVGGAVPLDSTFYIVRPTDGAFRSAISRRDSIVLVKGARQMGKTSLLARGLQQAREAGDRVVLTDFQKLNSAHLESAESLFMSLADSIADQLDLDTMIDETWNKRRGPNMNFERYLRREVLKKIDAHIVWGLDEVDRLFTTDFASEVFGLFRSWHNERSLDPTGPWQRLTLAIAYATEAHLFITDVNQSPFNVGTRLALADFGVEQVEELNRRYGSPLKTGGDVARFFRLVGGQPYLVRRGLHEMVSRGWEISDIEPLADSDEGPFGDHLRRILVLLVKDDVLCDAVREILQQGGCQSADAFYRLRSAGVMAGDSCQNVYPRCRIYASYLGRHLL